MNSTCSIYEKTYHHYLSRIAGLDLASKSGALGGKCDGSRIVVDFFNEPYAVSSEGICDISGKRPSYAVCIVLSQYVILCPRTVPSDADWVSYRDFKDAAPFAGAFANHAEYATARHFSGGLQRLETACGVIGARQPKIDLAYDLVRVIDALPKVPILLLFNDQDETFSASCSFLFEKRAEKYLDMECLAIIGWHLADRLKVICGGPCAGLL